VPSRTQRFRGRPGQASGQQPTGLVRIWVFISQQASQPKVPRPSYPSESSREARLSIAPKPRKSSAARGPDRADPASAPMVRQLPELRWGESNVIPKDERWMTQEARLPIG